MIAQNRKTGHHMFFFNEITYLGLTGFDSGQERYASMPGFDRTARQQRRSKHNWRKHLRSRRLIELQ